MSSRRFHVPNDPYVAHRIRAALADGPSERRKPDLPKPTPLEHLKRWKIAAAAVRSNCEPVVD
jgi:hypothetical protein